MMSDVRNGMPAAELTAVTGARWVKSSRSGPTGSNCVEVAFKRLNSSIKAVGRRVAAAYRPLSPWPDISLASP
jgi:Domain of unknown function (DUF397)